MTNFGTRLRLERTRLGLTQAALAAIGGVEANAQIAYEKDDRAPNAKYLANLAAHGVDINFLFYGEYANVGPSRRVTDLLSIVTQLPPTQQALGYVMLKLLKRTDVSAASLEQAEIFWRAAQVFDRFMEVDEASRTMIEVAAQFQNDAK